MINCNGVRTLPIEIIDQRCRLLVDQNFSGQTTRIKGEPPGVGWVALMKSTEQLLNFDALGGDFMSITGHYAPKLGGTPLLHNL